MVSLGKSRAQGPFPPRQVAPPSSGLLSASTELGFPKRCFGLRSTGKESAVVLAGGPFPSQTKQALRNCSGVQRVWGHPPQLRPWPKPSPSSSQG